MLYPPFPYPPASQSPARPVLLGPPDPRIGAVIVGTSDAVGQAAGRSLGARIFVGGLLGFVLGVVAFFVAVLSTGSFDVAVVAGLVLGLVGVALGARPGGGGGGPDGVNLLVGERGFQIAAGTGQPDVETYDSEHAVSLLLTRRVTTGALREALFVHDASGAFLAPVLDGLPGLRSVAWMLLERRAAARVPIERERLSRGSATRFHYEEPGGQRYQLELDSTQLRVPATAAMRAMVLQREGTVGSVRDGDIVLENGAARVALRFSSLADAPVLFALMTGQSLFAHAAGDAPVASQR